MKCSYCGEAAHTTLLSCPRIKLITYRADGSVLKVEMHTPMQKLRVGDIFTEVSGRDAVTLGVRDGVQYGRATR